MDYQQCGALWRLTGGGRPGRPDITMKRMTVKAFQERLSRYPDYALCCGTFWLSSDFLALDSSLTEDDIDAAIELSQYSHDADEGFNWSHLQWAIDEVKRGE